MVTYTIILYTHLFNNARLKFIIRRISHVDGRLSLVRGVNNSLDVGLKRKIHTFFIFFSISISFAMAFRHLTVVPYSATAIFGFFLPHFQPYAITAQFVIFLDLICNRFDVINGYIKHLKQTRRSKNNLENNLSLTKGELSTLSCVHNDLCDLCLLVNKYFNVQVRQSLGHKFEYLCTYLYIIVPHTVGRRNIVFESLSLESRYLMNLICIYLMKVCRYLGT